MIMSGFHPPGMKTMVSAFAEADLRDVQRLIDVPTLLLNGDKDVRSPVSVGQILHAQIPRSRLVVIPGVGHLSNVEAPGFNAELRSLLRSATGPQQRQSDAEWRRT